MGGILPREYKMLFLAQPGLTFDDNILPDSMIEDYFDAASYKMSIVFYIIVPPKEDGADLMDMENRLYPIMFDFYNTNNEKVRLFLLYYETETESAYEEIDIQKVEEQVYLGQEIWSLINMQNKFRIAMEK